MTDQSLRPRELPIDGAPTWLRILQAAVIGIVAGLALNAIVSNVVVQGEGLSPKKAAPSACKKSAPSRDAASPGTRSTPTISSLRRGLDMWSAGL
jgi:hypothetical protein